jgi:hypothetical protein
MVDGFARRLDLALPVGQSAYLWGARKQGSRPV